MDAPKVGTTDHHDEPPGQLISGALTDARELAAAEVDKLKTQARSVGEEVKVASVGVVSLLVAAVMVATALALGLAALGLPAWSGFAIVAAVFGAAGALFVTKRRALAGQAEASQKV